MFADWFCDGSALCISFCEVEEVIVVDACTCDIVVSVGVGCDLIGVVRGEVAAWGGGGVSEIDVFDGDGIKDLLPDTVGVAGFEEEELGDDFSCYFKISLIY